jgi:putative ABC transport system permease protein
MLESFEEPRTVTTVGEMVWANLRARPVRTVLSVAAVTLQVFLLLILMGLTDGIVGEWAERVQGIGADILVQPPNASPFIAFSSAILPEEMASPLRAVSGVQKLSPVVAVINTNSTSMIYGIDYESFNGLGTGFLIRAGGPFQGPNDVIIDDIKAKSKGHQLGETIELLNHRFRICGIVEHGRGARYFIPLRTAQELLAVEGRVSMFWIQTAGQPEKVHAQLVQLFPRHRIRLMSEYMSLMVSSNLPEVKPFTRAVILVGLVITFLVVLLSMYTVVLERTREIGILKALGASRWTIVGLLLREALVIAAVGAVLGVLASYGVEQAVRVLRPTLRIDVTLLWTAQGVALALGGCVLGSVYPALRAAAADPVSALAYE